MQNVDTVNAKHSDIQYIEDLQPIPESTKTGMTGKSPVPEQPDNEGNAKSVAFSDGNVPTT